jgi:hypothetical protein
VGLHTYRRTALVVAAAQARSSSSTRESDSRGAYMAVVAGRISYPLLLTEVVSIDPIGGSIGQPQRAAVGRSSSTAAPPVVRIMRRRRGMLAGLVGFA